MLVGLIAGAAHSQISREIEKETALGRHMAAEIDSRQKRITDAEVTGVVQRVLETLSRDESPRLPLELRVIDNSELVASALPGGFLVLSSGAILRADTEAELAGLLSHAMGHVQLGPFVVPATPGGIPLIFAGGRWGSCERSADGAGRMFAPVGSLSRLDIRESEADRLALEYMTNAGYDPQALVSVFEHWRGKSGLDEQVKSRALALTSATASTVLNTSAFDQMKQRLAPLPASPRRIPTLYK